MQGFLGNCRVRVLPTTEAGQRVPQGPIGRYLPAAQRQHAVHQGPSWIRWRPIALEPKPALAVSAQLAIQGARDLPAGADAADGEGTDPVTALTEAPALEPGPGEMPREPLHRRDRLAGEKLFDDVDVVWRIHGPRIAPGVIANG
jgi:hypothetical protein